MEKEESARQNQWERRGGTETEDRWDSGEPVCLTELPSVAGNKLKRMSPTWLKTRSWKLIPTSLEGITLLRCCTVEGTCWRGAIAFFKYLKGYHRRARSCSCWQQKVRLAITDFNYELNYEMKVPIPMSGTDFTVRQWLDRVVVSYPSLALLKPFKLFLYWPGVWTK